MLLWPEKSSASLYWPLAAAAAPPIMLATSGQLAASFFTQLAGGDSYVAVWPLPGCGRAQHGFSPVHKMPPQDGYFFFWGDMLPFLLIRSLRYLNGRTLSPFLTEAGQFFLEVSNFTPRRRFRVSGSPPGSVRPEDRSRAEVCRPSLPAIGGCSGRCGDRSPGFEGSYKCGFFRCGRLIPPFACVLWPGRPAVSAFPFHRVVSAARACLFRGS